MRDPYDILGVERSDDAETIKRSYRRLAFRYHPDRNEGDPEAAERFREICEAYERIDPEGRCDGSRAGVSSTWTDVGLEALARAVDAFEQGWRGRQPPPADRPRDGRDRFARVRVSFEETVSGTETRAHFSVCRRCESCDGRGGVPDAEWHECDRCAGRGEIRGGLLGLGERIVCNKCRGRGQIASQWCDVCDGVGEREVETTETVQIPAGVRDGQRIVLEGCGEPGRRGGESGDLLVDVSVEEHERFERRGRDIITEVEVPFSDAVLGGEVTFETPSGSIVMEIPAGTTDGQRFRLRSRGFPNAEGGGSAGHLIVVARVAGSDEYGRDGTLERTSPTSWSGRVASTVRRVVARSNPNE